MTYWNVRWLYTKFLNNYFIDLNFMVFFIQYAAPNTEVIDGQLVVK